MPLPPLHRRVLDLCYHHRLGHIGSCLGAADILDDIYSQRGATDPVILSCGHAAVGLYVVLEKWLGKDAEDLLTRHTSHPHKDLADGIYCSTGSLGQGMTVAVGYALANRTRPTWVVTSDGELTEGAALESLSFAERAGLSNLRVYVNANGFSAYQAMPMEHTFRLAHTLFPQTKVVMKTVDSYGIPFLKGLLSHYYVIKDQDWAWVEGNS